MSSLETAVIWATVGLMAFAVGFTIWAARGELGRLRKRDAESWKVEERAQNAEDRSLRVPFMWHSRLCTRADCLHLTEKWALDSEEVGGAHCCHYLGPPEVEGVGCLCPHLRIEVTDDVVLEDYKAWAYTVAMTVASDAAEEARDE